ncbi:UNVERIFIED_CONTAM: hypothetical protein FKN15_048527 [Acipenser sinensis]
MVSGRSTSSVPYNVQWVTRKYPLASLVPKCDSVKSRGALVTAFSGDGLLLAIALNQKDAKASQVLFVSTLNFITISSSLKGCGSKDHSVPSKYVRSYWVGDMSWTPDNLYLACMLKRGSLLFVTRLGDLLTLTTFGCSVEFGPAEFIPLHPLITYRLVEVWKMLYHQTLLYQASLHRQAVQQGSHPADQTLQHEESWYSYLLAQIQAALQAAGQTLGKSRKLNSVAGTFRELCSLCWMFHVRERLSASCRKYQLARNSARDPEGYVGAVEYDAGVAEHCLDALEWACRLLPFARFMNAEEITQDVILSLVGELPPIRKVAEVLVKVFPEQEDSVRVPLREKYNCLLQRLMHSTVKGTVCPGLDGLAVHSRVSRKLAIQEGGGVTMPEVIALMQYTKCQSWIGGDVIELAIAGA